jgi:hypothetical protein
MAILMIMDLEGATTEQYDALNDAIQVDENNLPQGLIQHAAGPTDEGGLLIVDVWESEEDLGRFFEEKVGPAMAQLKLPAGQPRVHEVHNHIPQGSGSDGSFILLIESEGFSPGDYDAITGHMDAHAGDGSNHPAVTHVAAITEDGMVFMDIWDSPESVEKFLEEEVAQASEAAGASLGEVQPRIVPVHNRYVAGG